MNPNKQIFEMYGKMMESLYSCVMNPSQKKVNVECQCNETPYDGSDEAYEQKVDAERSPIQFT